jgi:hypothetical protein
MITIYFFAPKMRHFGFIGLFFDLYEPFFPHNQNRDNNHFNCRFMWLSSLMDGEGFLLEQTDRHVVPI